MAPGLVQVHEKYKHRDVVFVSLTNMPEASVQEFVDHCSISWSCGYGAQQTIAGFGAFRLDSKVPGYEITPMLYLIGGDGKIHWCDAGARTVHTDRGEQLRTLDQQIERALINGTFQGK
jgi:hypothetical protein